MANEEVLGPRKTMFVLVIVVGCFAVLWPRIISPLVLGTTRDQLQPNQFDRDAAIKQERPPIRGAGPHPALRERGRAIPPGAPPASPQVHIQMPPNVRVRSSPLSGYFELDIKPPPIPGMRPPLGGPGGPVPAPKTSMGFVMPIYTICIIVFFVYTISKLFFKRATIPYEPVTPDPHFRRRVFRDDSRSSPDKLGHKERDTIVTAISGLVAEVQQQMEAGYAQNQQRQDVQDNHTRPYTNGTIIHNSGPVHIFTSEYNEAKDKTPEEPTPEPKTKSALEELSEEPEKEDKQSEEVELTENKVPGAEKGTEAEIVPEVKESEEIAVTEISETKVEDVIKDIVSEESQNEIEESQDQKEEIEVLSPEESIGTEAKEVSPKEETEKEIPETIEADKLDTNSLIDLTEPIELKKNGDIGKTVEDFLREEAKDLDRIENETAKELQEAADDDDDKDIEQEKSSVKVMGMETTAHSADGGSPPAPPAAPAPRPPASSEEVKSIYLETAIPQQTRVLVADFAEDTPRQDSTTRNSPMVVSGKMTLSLIQDAPRDTPDRDLESTVDDYTTASAITQPAEKEGSESEEEIEEEIEVEEIEEEVEEEELELEEEPEQAEKKPEQGAVKKGTE